MMHHQTTIDQIGRVQLGYVGARNFTSTADSLRFTIGRGHHCVTVTLEANDTYSVMAQQRRSGRVTYEQHGVYCEQLTEAVWQAHLER